VSSSLLSEPKDGARSNRSGSPLAFPENGKEFDLVGILLEQQQTLSAVEVFSEAHDAGQLNVPAQAFYYRRLMPATAPRPGQQLAFEVNLDSCSGCKACVVACHTLNGLEENESWRKVGTLTIGVTEPELVVTPTAIAVEPSPVSIGMSGVQHVTTACHHCEDPGCLNGCPVKAYVKDDATGIVRHLDDQCIGCKYCTMMCPYEVPKYSKRLGIVRKCDMCHQRLKSGEAPACVQSCPNEAIAIRIVDTLGSVIEQGDRLMPAAPLSSITRPTTRYVSRRDAAVQTAIPQDLAIDEVAESHWPLAIMLVTTQVAVGMILLERLVAGVTFVMGGSLPMEATRLTASVAFAIAMIGMNLAPLHLGQPLRAWRVFLGLRTSWLSREAVLLGKFVGALGVALLLMWWPVLSQYVPDSIRNLWPQSIVIASWAASAALMAAVLLGLAGLYSSAMIYIVTRRELWRAERTLPRFASTGVIVGGAATALALTLIDGASPAVLPLIIVSVISGAAKLMLEWTTVSRFGCNHLDTNSLDARSLRLITRQLNRWWQLRLVAGTLGLMACLLAMGTFATGANTAGVLLLACGSVGLIVSESAERLLYFMSVVYDRMPGTLK
jgi:Fe-S-cluster-containing dehydrogenase component/DMSO reductase anchor subunit